METKGVPLNIIRGLIIEQQGCCAITGSPLDPADVNGDHIIPLSRSEMNPSDGADNIWLVDKRVNAMKGTMTYDELIDMARKILAHEGRSRELIETIRSQGVMPVEKAKFDEWVAEKCDANGRVVRHPAHRAC